MLAIIINKNNKIINIKEVYHKEFYKKALRKDDIIYFKNIELTESLFLYSRNELEALEEVDDPHDWITLMYQIFRFVK